jgi:hypothetical protein
MDFIPDAIAILKYFGFQNPANAAGWIIAALVCAFMIWRLNIMDKRLDTYADKMTEVIKAQQEEWRKLVNRTDEMTFDMLETSTQTMTTLTEKISTLQMIILQNGRKG